MSEEKKTLLPIRRNDDTRPRYIIGMYLLADNMPEIENYEDATVYFKDGTKAKVPLFLAGSVGEITDRAKKLHNFATEKNMI